MSTSDVRLAKIKQAAREYADLELSPLIFIKNGILLESSLADWRNMSIRGIMDKINSYAELEKPSIALSLKDTGVIILDCGFVYPEDETDGVNFFLRYFNGRLDTDREKYLYPRTLILAERTAKLDGVVPETALEENGKRTRVRLFFRYPEFISKDGAGFIERGKRCRIEIRSGTDYFFAPPSTDPKSIDKAEFYYNDGIKLIPWVVDGKKTFDIVKAMTSIHEYPEIKHLIDTYWTGGIEVNLNKPEMMFHEWDRKRRSELGKTPLLAVKEQSSAAALEDSLLHTFLRLKTIPRPESRIQAQTLLDRYNRYLEERGSPPVGRDIFAGMMTVVAPHIEKRKIGAMYYMGIDLA